MIVDELAVRRRRQQYLPYVIGVYCDREGSRHTGGTRWAIGQFELIEPDPDDIADRFYLEVHGTLPDRLWGFNDLADPLPGKLLRRSRRLSHVKQAQLWIAPDGRVCPPGEACDGAYLRYHLRCDVCGYALTRRADDLWPVLDELAAKYVVALALTELGA